MDANSAELSKRPPSEAALKAMFMSPSAAGVK
jgi:hypothetical protein